MTRAVMLALGLLATVSVGYAQEPGATSFEVAGIPVIFKSVDANEVIAVQVYLKGGSTVLDDATSGIERLMISAATRGTERYDKDVFARRAAATGAGIGGQALYDYSVMTLQAVTTHWDESWDLFTQALLHPTYPEAEVTLVREQIVNALKGRDDNPDQRLAWLANDLLYDGHPYATDPAGTVESIAAMTAADVRGWHARRMVPENLLIVVVGNVDGGDLIAKIESAFGSLPVTDGDAEPAPVADPGTPDLVVEERDLPTNYIRSQFITPRPGDPDYAPFRIAADILSDRFFEEVRTKRNLSYAVFSGVSQRRSNYGLLYVTAVEPDTTIQVMFHEVDRLKSEPVTEERLAESRNVFTTQYWMSQETNMGQATTLGTFELVGGGWERAGAFIDEVQAITPEDVQRVAGSYLGGFHTAVIGDPTKIDRTLFTSR